MFPFKVFFLPSSATGEGSSHAVWPEVLISVPKRNFKRAVDRNYLKRRIREAYRLHKATYHEKLVRFDALAFVYVAKEKQSFAYLYPRLAKALDQLP